MLGYGATMCMSRHTERQALLDMLLSPRLTCRGIQEDLTGTGGLHLGACFFADTWDGRVSLDLAIVRPATDDASGQLLVGHVEGLGATQGRIVLAPDTAFTTAGRLSPVGPAETCDMVTVFLSYS